MDRAVHNAIHYEIEISPELSTKIEELYKTLPIYEIEKLVPVSHSVIKKHLRDLGYKSVSSYKRAKLIKVPCGVSSFPCK